MFSKVGGGSLLYVKFNPGGSADGTEAHYHTFHEWGYVFEGDFPLYEFVSPNQKKGTLMKMRPGTFMDRPAYSIHGNRAASMESQIVTTGSTQLLFYEPGTYLQRHMCRRMRRVLKRRSMQCRSPIRSVTKLIGFLMFSFAVI